MKMPKRFMEFLLWLAAAGVLYAVCWLVVNAALYLWLFFVRHSG